MSRFESAQPYPRRKHQGLLVSSAVAAAVAAGTSGYYAFKPSPGNGHPAPKKASITEYCDLPIDNRGVKTTEDKAKSVGKEAHVVDPATGQEYLGSDMRVPDTDVLEVSKFDPAFCGQLGGTALKIPTLKS